MRLQRTKECDILILYAKIMKGQSFYLEDVLKSFLQYTYILFDFGDVHRVTWKF